MKKIMKVDAILTNVTARYENMPKDGTVKNPKWSYFSYHVGDQIVTSENSMTVNYMSQEGNHMTVWYVESKPKKVYKYKVLAMLLG